MGNGPPKLHGVISANLLELVEQHLATTEVVEQAQPEAEQEPATEQAEQ